MEAWSELGLTSPDEPSSVGDPRAVKHPDLYSVESFTVSGAPNDDAVRVLELPHADFKLTTLLLLTNDLSFTARN